MSPSGHERRFKRKSRTSAFPPIPDKYFKLPRDAVVEISREVAI
jgi:hypothetical protein